MSRRRNGQMRASEVGATAPTSISDRAWSEPIPITFVLPPVPRIDPSLVPDPLREYVSYLARDFQMRLDAPAVAMMVALAGAVGSRALIQPKERSPWRERAVGWGGPIMSSGRLKTPLLTAILKPLHLLQSERLTEYRQQFEEYELRKQAGEDPPVPRCIRYLVNDATVARLHEILRDNPGGILVHRDELMGLVNKLNKNEQDGDKQFFMEAYNSGSGFMVDRITRGSQYAERTCVSIIGGIQPAMFQDIVTKAVKSGDFADGFIPRFQFMVWPDDQPEWSYVDEPLPEDVEERVTAVFRRVVEWDPSQPRLYRFNADAQEAFKEYLALLEHRLRHEITEDVMCAHLGKQRGLMPMIAMLHQIAEDPDTDLIPLHRAWRAWRWCNYLEAHARRAYACVLQGRLPPAQTLARRIQAGALGSVLTVRDVRERDWTGLKTVEEVEAVLRELETAGWVRSQSSDHSPRGGRPTVRYHVNPRVYTP